MDASYFRKTVVDKPCSCGGSAGTRPDGQTLQLWRICWNMPPRVLISCMALAVSSSILTTPVWNKGTCTQRPFMYVLLIRVHVHNDSWYMYCQQEYMYCTQQLFTTVLLQEYVVHVHNCPLYICTYTCMYYDLSPMCKMTTRQISRQCLMRCSSSAWTCHAWSLDALMRKLNRFQTDHDV